MSRGLRRTAPVAALLLLAGCAETPRIIYSSADLHAELVRRVGPARAATLQVPFEVEPALVEMARDLARDDFNATGKLQILALALADPNAFNLTYDREITGTAAETLERRRGDCLSLTSTFVGLARADGLNVFFVDARGIQEFATEGDLFIDRRHIVAGYGIPPQIQIVDFDRLREFNVQYRVLSDLQALARYYNNLGYGRLRDGDNAGAREEFETAIALDPTFAGAHNNLAVALARDHENERAEKHLQIALKYEPVYSAAMVNLAGLYERTGRTEEAAETRRQAGALRLRDPIWRLSGGLDALRVGDYERAVKDLQAAVAIDPDLAIGWLRLAQALDALGETKRAGRALDRVLRLQPNQAEALAMKARLGS